MADRSPFERALRRRSRTALYCALAVTAAAAWAGRWHLERLARVLITQPWVGQDYASLPEVRRLQRYLQIDTSQPGADELSGARFLAAELERGGVTPVLDEVGGRRANLWAILEGESREAVVLHQHIDTDPVTDLEAWSHPPFSGAIDPSQIWGRGAFDMKGIGIAQLEAFLDLVATGRRPKRSVIFLATGSEEVDSKLGMRRILETQPDLVGRFWTFLTEGGMVEALNTTELKYWGTEFAQRRVVDVWFHGDREPLETLRSRLLARDLRSPPRLVPEASIYLAAYAPTRGVERLRQLLADPPALVAQRDRWAELPRYLQSLFVDEVFVSAVRNEEGGGLGVRLRVLLLPRTTLEPTLSELVPETLWRDLDLDRTIDEGHPPASGSPLDHPAYRAIAAVVAERIGGDNPAVSAGPAFLTTAATDARFVRALGVPAYGFSPFLASSMESLGIGKGDERLSLAAFVDGVRLYRALLSRLAEE